MKFGIVQGRLTESQELQAFPKDWQNELVQASLLGFDYVELLIEREWNIHNPIWTGKIQGEIVCDDYIINHGMSDIKTLNMIRVCEKIGCKKLIFPLFEKAKDTSKDLLLEMELAARRHGMDICLETNENDHPFNIVYDTGNRVVEGINLARDIKRLGKRIAHVHIKDKDFNGNNVLLGTGEVDFKEVCQALKDIGYDGTMTFETVRGKDPIRTAKYNLEFIKFFLSEAQ